jgi:hypothetical protein
VLEAEIDRDCQGFIIEDRLVIITEAMMDLLIELEVLHSRATRGAGFCGPY